MKELKYEKEYIQYLIKIGIRSDVLENYLSNKIDFINLILNLDLDHVLSFQSFVKSKKIDELLSENESFELKSRDFNKNESDL